MRTSWLQIFDKLQVIAVDWIYFSRKKSGGWTGCIDFNSSSIELVKQLERQKFFSVDEISIEMPLHPKVHSDRLYLID